MEYNFPVVATSRDKHQPNAMATEVVRVASKNITDGGRDMMISTLAMFKDMF